MYDQNTQDQKQVVDAIQNGIRKEVTAINLYERLLESAPNQVHKEGIVHTLESKKSHLTQITNLFTHLTGQRPNDELADQVSFTDYSDGLEKVYQTEVQGYEEFQRSGLFTPNDHTNRHLSWASSHGQVSGNRHHSNQQIVSDSIDYGSSPFVVDIEKATQENTFFRTALWTGTQLQVTLMSIDVGEDIGLEQHPNLDQFIRIEEGQGLVQMGDQKDQLNFQKRAFADDAILIPAGKWHNLTNTGNNLLKLYSIYAPPEHPYGTVHETKEDAMAAENNHY
ncbi:cupin domain-containing protein [Bacillus suaedae]|nr:cupin domain-containing protein [Bacillus suaedae]